MFFEERRCIFKLMSNLNKIKKYFLNELSITVIPSPDKRIKNYSIRRIFPATIFLLIILTVIVLSYLYNYYHTGFLDLADTAEELKIIRAENERLRTELYVLAQETEELMEYLNELQEYKEEIKGMIGMVETEEEESESIALELHTSITSITSSQVLPTRLPIGGGDMQFYHPSWQVIDRAKDNIDLIKRELPDRREELSNLESSVKEYNALMAATPSIWPLADKGDSYISSNFGWRKDPFSGRQALHEGLDIGTWYNTPVVATADGIVTCAGNNGGYGLMVIVEHDYGYETRYAHLNKVKVKKGQKVSRGDAIALSGNSGRSSGPHLHYEVRINNIPQNPRNYIGR